MHTVTLHDGSVQAKFIPSAGMIGVSLSDNGVELLGQRRGLDAYISAGKTMGLPVLYPWANRLSTNTFDADGTPVHIAPRSEERRVGKERNDQAAAVDEE